MDDLGTVGKLREPTQQNLQEDVSAIVEQIRDHWHGLVHPVVLLFNPATKTLVWGSTLDLFSARSLLRDAQAAQLQRTEADPDETVGTYDIPDPPP